MCRLSFSSVSVGTQPQTDPLCIKQAVVCSSACSQCEVTFFHAPALPVKPKDSVGAAALQGGYQQLQKEQIPTVDMS